MVRAPRATEIVFRKIGGGKIKTGTGYKYWIQETICVLSIQ